MWRWSMRLLRGALHLLMFAFVLATLLLALAFTPFGRPIVLQVAVLGANMAGLPFKISASGLGAGWPTQLGLSSLELADGEGPWLKILKPELHWNPQALREYHLDIAQLKAERIVLLRAPVLPEQKQAQEQTGSPPPAFSVTLNLLDIGEITLPNALTLTSLKAKASLQNGLLDATLTELAIPAHNGNVTAGVMHNLATGLGQLNIQGSSTASGPFAAEAAFDLSNNQTSITLGKLRAVPDGQVLELKAPLTLQLHGDDITLAPFTLTYGIAQLDGKAEQKGDTLAAELNWQKLRLPGLQLVDNTHGQLQLSGHKAQPKLTGQIQATATAPLAAQLGLHFTYEGQQLGSQLNLRQGNRQLLAGQVTLQRLPTLFALNLPALLKAQLNGQIDGTIPLDWLAKQERINLPPVKGQATIKAVVTGTVGSPLPNGQLSLRGVAYDDLTSGLRLRDGLLDATTDGKNIIITQLKAGDGAAGQLNGSGSYNDGTAAITVQMSKFQLANLALAKARGTGNLNLSQEKGGRMKLAGQLDITEASVRIPERLPTSIARLPVTERGKPRQRQPAQTDAPQSTLPLDFDLALNIPGPLKLSGRGLMADFGDSKLQVSGDAATPIVSGSIGLLRGQYDFLGKRLKLGEGQLSFDGGAVHDPALNLNAVYTGPSITATVTIGGRASDPRITLTSTPALPQDEIISSILFGKTSTSLSPLQALQLAQAAAGLVAGDGGFDPLAKIRSGLGLDQLEVSGGDESTGTSSSVEIGKSIGNNVYITTKQNLSGKGSSVGVDVKLSPALSLHSSSSESSPANLQLRYQRDY